MARHLIWDWNGTLFDDIHVIVDATNESLVACGGTPITPEEHRNTFRRPIPDFYADMLRRPMTEVEFGIIDRVFHATYDRGLPTARLAPEALDVLGAWPHTQSLLSMWFHKNLVPTVTRLQLDSYFVRIDGLRAKVGGATKESSLAAHLAALGLTGADCVLIGDDIDDAAAARAVGADCILYSQGIVDVKRLRTTGAPVVDTLTEALGLAGFRP